MNDFVMIVEQMMVFVVDVQNDLFVDCVCHSRIMDQNDQLFYYCDFVYFEILLVDLYYKYFVVDENEYYMDYMGFEHYYKVIIVVVVDYIDVNYMSCMKLAILLYDSFLLKIKRKEKKKENNK